ncbi:hypothetical protein [Streptomyces sp. NBC_01353]|uniref:hypothetical protein n=1 Tax=Streptomyces sp. NBC_01353 TaxID=2903835 RepID=UPI002E2EBFCD|nr:hypothetical protein [Streptomyces sp. NBC_01353]
MKLMVEIDGQTLPLNDCFWILADTNGCAFASVRGDCAASAEQAHERITPRVRDRAKETKNGQAVRLLTRDQWKQQAEPCFLGRCEHRAEAAA